MQFGGPHGRPHSPLLLDHGNITFLPTLECECVMCRVTKIYSNFCCIFLLFHYQIWAIGLCHFCPIWWAPWATPYTILNDHGNISSLHIYTLVSMFLPINSHPFFTFCIGNEIFVFYHFCSLMTPMGDPFAPSFKWQHQLIDYFDKCKVF